MFSLIGDSRIVSSSYVSSVYMTVILVDQHEAEVSDCGTVTSFQERRKKTRGERTHLLRYYVTLGIRFDNFVTFDTEFVSHA